MARTPLARTSIRDALDSALIAMTASGVESARLDAELLLAEAMGVDRAVIVADPGRGVEPDAARRFGEYARRRVQREPVAYILGRKGFRAIELAVDPRVLIPRPETEHLVEAALELPRGARVVDVGTGSGAVALALKHERPDLEILATDAAGAALDVELLHGDLLEPVAGRVDAVVSNPPYVAEAEWRSLAPEITRHEPAGALLAGADGLAVIRRLAPAASGAAMLAIEIGATQGEAVSAIAHAAGFRDVRVVPDLAGHDRVVVGRR